MDEEEDAMLSFRKGERRRAEGRKKRNEKGGFQGLNKDILVFAKK
jgi:hypothetical protein